MFSRMLYGGIGGGVLGWAASDRNEAGGAIGGLVGGAVGAGPGMWLAGRLMGKRTLAGMAGSAMDYGAKGFGFVEKKLGSNRTTSPYLRKYWAGSLRQKFTGGLTSAQDWIGKNAIGINKYGGYALNALGAGSAALMGSSILDSNRGY